MPEGKSKRGRHDGPNGPRPRPTKPRRRQNEAQRAAAERNLAIGMIRKGEVRNPTGLNGWTAARRKVKDILSRDAAEMAEMLVALAKVGDDKALRIALGPLLPAQKHEIEHTGEVSFKWQD